MEHRRNASRELEEKKVETEIAKMKTTVADLENRLVRYSLGLIGSLSMLSLGVARIFL